MGNVCETCVYEPECEDAAEAKERHVPIEGCGEWEGNWHEYTVQLYSWLPNGERLFEDETSVDALSDQEAKNVALDVFTEARPFADKEYMRENLEISNKRPLTEQERRELQVQSPTRLKER